MIALEKYCRVKDIKQYIFQFCENIHGIPFPRRVGGERADTAGRTESSRSPLTAHSPASETGRGCPSV